MKHIALLSAALALSACGSGPPPLQLHAEHPVHLARGLPGLKVADAALGGGLPETALAITRGLLAENPNNVPALVKQGEALLALGRADGAAECFRRALSIKPGSQEAMLALGRMHLAAGQAAEAETQFRNVAASTPGNTLAQNDLGIALDLLGRHAEAQTAYRAALRSAPEMDAAQVNLGISLEMSGATPAQTTPAGSPSRRANDGTAMALAVTGPAPAFLAVKDSAGGVQGAHAAK